MLTILQISADANTIQAWVSLAQFLFSSAAVGIALYTLALQQKTLQSQLEVQKMETVINKGKLQPVINFRVFGWYLDDDEDSIQIPEKYKGFIE